MFFLSYQLNTPFDRTPPPYPILYLISIFPTIVLIRMIKLLFIFQFNTEGLTFSEGSQVYETYSINGGLFMLYFMTLIYSLLGIYLDQVVPMEFGVSKPWNFCCKSSAKRSRSNG